MAIDKQSIKQQLLNRILSQEEDGTNETSARLNNAESVKNNVENIKDKILEEAGLTLSKDEAKQVNQDDNKILSVHASKQGSNCRSGDVLAGASNKKDLKILSNWEEVIGTVKHTKKMNDGDYKFALKVRDQYKDLLNKINNKKTGGYLIVEIVPKDQKHNEDVVKPKTGDIVDVWGAWVTDKPKGWHEIHPAWKVVKVK
jgi:protein-tyrosine-phosphatase